MPRDAMGNVIPGLYGPGAMGIKPMNPSPAASRLLQGTARALANPGAMQRNPMATQALQRASAGIAPPPAPVGTNPSDRAAQMLAMQQDAARMQAARSSAVPAAAVAAAPDRAAQQQAMLADRARMQAARAGAQPMDVAAQQQAQQADLMRQRQMAMQRPRGLGTVMA